MKLLSHVVLLLFAICMYSCTKSPEEKAQILFEESIKQELGQPELYEFIKMTKLDSVYSTVEDDRDYLKLQDSLKLSFDPFSLLYESDKDKKDRENLVKRIEEYKQSFKPSFIGWHSLIDFRAENLFGGVQIYKVDAYFNEDLTQILDVSLKGEKKKKKHHFAK